MNEHATVILHPKRERSVARGHPWIFSGAVKRVDGTAGPGDIVSVLSHEGEFVAYGFLSPRSMIRVRILETSQDRTVDEAWWEEKILAALSRRTDSGLPETSNACRLVYSEADMLPGLIVDRYSDFLVVQLLSVGIEKIKDLVVHTLVTKLGPECIYERSSGDSRALEGLEERNGTLYGKEPPDLVEVVEGGCRFLVDVVGGQKTGFYLDQVANRAIAASYATERTILDCFAYTGAFSVRALGTGAKSVVLVESSEQALSLAERNVKLNVPDATGEYVCGNVFTVLRNMRDQGRTFDMIVLDPPKLARSKSQTEKAGRAYKDANLLAMKLLSPGGLLITFSCSGAVDAELFTEIVHWSAMDAGRNVQVLRRMGQGEDHPIRLGFPESEYLKGLLCRVE